MAQQGEPRYWKDPLGYDDPYWYRRQQYGTFPSYTACVCQEQLYRIEAKLEIILKGLRDARADELIELANSLRELYDRPLLPVPDKD